MNPCAMASGTTLRVCALSFLVFLVPVSKTSAEDTEQLRAILVTGTSSGIGRRMTEVLSTNGFFVYAGARKTEDLKRLDAMPNVMSVRLDVTIQSEIDAAVELVNSEGRGLYGLINNAGVSAMGPLIETPEEDADFLLEVNLLGPYRVLHHRFRAAVAQGTSPVPVEWRWCQNTVDVHLGLGKTWPRFN
jgi:NAD(P)-dependent dehydrogenase (short-subunit alcohol dehydrogenase family)